MVSSVRFLFPISACVLAGLTSSVVHAGGFYVPEVGARSISMANAQVAQSQDTTALFHNVAGIAGLGGVQGGGCAEAGRDRSRRGIRGRIGRLERGNGRGLRQRRPFCVESSRPFR